jgi:hypothetical protein
MRIRSEAPQYQLLAQFMWWVRRIAYLAHEDAGRKRVRSRSGTAQDRREYVLKLYQRPVTRPVV